MRMLEEYVRLAFRMLGAYRLRSFLTVLSITIGVCSIILLTSLAQSGFATLSKGIEEIGGTRFIMLFPDSPKKAAQKASNYRKGLTYGDARAISANPLIERMTAFSSANESPVRVPGGEEKRTDFVQSDERFLDMFALKLEKGRNLSAEDLLEHRRVAVIGDDLAKKLFPEENPLGHELVLSGERYRIVGKLAYASKQGFHLGFSFSDVAIAPLKRSEGSVGMIALASRDSTRNGELLDQINALLLHRHNQVDDFQFLDFGGLLKGFYAAFFGMILVVGLISGVSLLIGGVGIMNIMLVSVAERRREIGLRKAVGGSRSTILAQFLIESVVLSLFGAFIGVFLGIGLAQTAAVVGPMINRSWVGVISQPAILLALLSAIAIGVFFGWYPAKQAAESDPILCLRSE